MKACYDNKVLTSTITSSSESLTNTFVQNLVNPWLSRRGFTTGISNEWLKFYNAGGIETDYVIIMSHNLTSAAVVYIEGNDTDVWTSPAYRKRIYPYNIGFLTDEFGEMITDEFGDPITLTIHYKDSRLTNDVRFTEINKTTYKYWRLTIHDPSNLDDHLEIGYVFLGNSLAWPSPDVALKLPIRSSSTQNYSETGQLYGNKKIRFRDLEIKFQGVEQEDRNNIDLMFALMDTVTPWVLLLWENSPEIEEPLYCSFMEALEWDKDQSEGVSYSLGIKVKEAK